MIYTTQMLIEKYKNYINPKSKIKRLCNEGKLINVCHGLYEDDKSVSLTMISSYIYGPSYVSFSFVLSMYSLIPEFGLNVTCATFGKNKTKFYSTPFGNVLYRDVPKSVFPYGVERKDIDGHIYYIATKEKAFCDFLYTRLYQAVSLDDFKIYLFDDLRIDEDEFELLDFEFILNISPLYKKKNFDYLIEYIKKESLRW